MLHGCPNVLHDCPNVLHGSAIVTRLLSLTLAFVSKHSGNVTSAMENVVIVTNTLFSDCSFLANRKTAQT